MYKYGRDYRRKIRRKSQPLFAATLSATDFHDGQSVAEKPSATDNPSQMWSQMTLFVVVDGDETEEEEEEVATGGVAAGGLAGLVGRCEGLLLAGGIEGGRFKISGLVEEGRGVGRVTGGGGSGAGGVKGGGLVWEGGSGGSILLQGWICHDSSKITATDFVEQRAITGCLLRMGVGNYLWDWEPGSCCVMKGGTKVVVLSLRRRKSTTSVAGVIVQASRGLKLEVKGANPFLPPAA